MFLFTRRNRNDRQAIHVDGSWEKSNLSTSFFNPAHPVKIIIHGYNSDMFLSSLIDMKDGELIILADVALMVLYCDALARAQNTWNAVNTICSTSTGVSLLRHRAT